MKARRLATTEEVIAIVSPDSDDALEAIESWTSDRDITLNTVSVGDDIYEVHSPGLETVGVTLGGDGTYLEGVRVFAPRNIPFLGVNTGTLAFLASVAPEDLGDALTEVALGKAQIEQRQQITVQANGIDSTGINDVMVEHAMPDNPVDRKITRLEVYADGEFVGEYEGSGIAVATPTGSTGVSLSAGGPVHLPQNNETLQVVPLQTHRLGVRPLIVDADTELEIVSKGTADLLVDGGRTHAKLNKDDVVTVTGAENSAQVIETSYDDPFFASVSEKLGWSIRDDQHDEGTTYDRSTEKGQSDINLLEHARQVAMEAGRSAGKPLRELHGQTESIEYKSDKSDIVTEADYKAENIITTVIQNEFPDHNILSEESVQEDRESDYTWVIDPLDGTGNFAHGNPNYSISIALLENYQPAMGVVYAPETNEMFSAITGGTARQNREPISTTDRTNLAESMMLSGYDPDGEFLTHCYRETRGVRRLGSAALSLCYLASGSADATWEYDTFPWDVCAGIVIARAAGGKITDLSGNPYVMPKKTDRQIELVGSNGPLHSSLLNHLKTLDVGASEAMT